MSEKRRHPREVPIILRTEGEPIALPWTATVFWLAWPLPLRVDASTYLVFLYGIMRRFMFCTRPFRHRWDHQYQLDGHLFTFSQETNIKMSCRWMCSGVNDVRACQSASIVAAPHKLVNLILVDMSQVPTIDHLNASSAPF